MTVTAVTDREVLAVTECLYEHKELIHREDGMRCDLPVKLKHLTKTLAGFHRWALSPRVRSPFGRHDAKGAGQATDGRSLSSERR